MCKPAIIKTIFRNNRKFYKILKPYTKEVTEKIYDTSVVDEYGNVIVNCKDKYTTVTKIVTAYKEMVIPASYYNSL